MNQPPDQTGQPGSAPDDPTTPPAAARRPVALVATIVIVAVLGLSWLVWAALEQAREPKVQVLGYRVQGQSVTVRFEVVKPSEDGVACVVRARDASGLEVARARVVIGPGRSRAVVSRRLVATAVPVSGEVAGCTAR